MPNTSNISVPQKGMIDDIYKFNTDQTYFSFALNAIREDFYEGNLNNIQNEPSNIFLLSFPPDYDIIGFREIHEQKRVIFILHNSKTGNSQLGELYNCDKEILTDRIRRTYCADCDNEFVGEERVPLEKQEEESFCDYKIIAGTSGKCYNFSKHYPVDIEYKLRNDGINIYLTDGLNERIFLYFDYKDNDPTKELLLQDRFKKQTGTTIVGDCKVPVYRDVIDCNKIKLHSNYTRPCVNFHNFVAGGSLKSGATYQVIVGYADVYGNKLGNYYPSSQIIPLFENQIFVDGTYNTNKALKFSVENLKAGGVFNYYNVVIAETIDNFTEFYKIGTYSTTQTEHIYTGYELFKERLDPTEVFGRYPFYKTAKTVTKANGYLIYGQVREYRVLNLQPAANQVKLYWETIGIREDAYNDPKYNYYFRTYQRDEVYAPAIIFEFDNGRETCAFHIPGRAATQIDQQLVCPPNNDVYNPYLRVDDYHIPSSVEYCKPRWKIYNTANIQGKPHQYINGDEETITQLKQKCWEWGEFGYYESSEKYPNVPEVWGDLCGKPIRFHKFPDSSITHIHDGKDEIKTFEDNNYIYPVGIRINHQSVINALNDAVTKGLMTQEERNTIKSYRIVRGNRVGNKSINAKGLLFNVLEYTKTYKDRLLTDNFRRYYAPNYGYNDITETFLADTQLSDLTRYTFHSPDTHFVNTALGNYLKIETEEYGQSQGEFTYSECEAKQKILSVFAQTLAFGLGLAAAITATTKNYRRSIIYKGDEYRKESGDAEDGTSFLSRLSGTTRNTLAGVEAPRCNAKPMDILPIMGGISMFTNVAKGIVDSIFDTRGGAGKLVSDILEAAPIIISGIQGFLEDGWKSGKFWSAILQGIMILLRKGDKREEYEFDKKFIRDELYFHKYVVWDDTNRSDAGPQWKISGETPKKKKFWDWAADVATGGLATVIKDNREKIMNVTGFCELFPYDCVRRYNGKLMYYAEYAKYVDKRTDIPSYENAPSYNTTKEVQWTRYGQPTLRKWITPSFEGFKMLEFIDYMEINEVEDIISAALYTKKPFDPKLTYDQRVNDVDTTCYHLRLSFLYNFFFFAFTEKRKYSTKQVEEALGFTCEQIIELYQLTEEDLNGSMELEGTTVEDTKLTWDKILRGAISGLIQGSIQAQRGYYLGNGAGMAPSEVRYDYNDDNQYTTFTCQASLLDTFFGGIIESLFYDRTAVQRLFLGIHEMNKILDTMKVLVPYKQYGIQYNSIGRYNGYSIVPNSTENKLRYIEKSAYVTPIMQTIDEPSRYDKNKVDSIILNNVDRESTVYLKLNYPIDLPTRVDNSKVKMSSIFGETDLNKLDTTFYRDISSYYGSIKSDIANQYGQLCNIEYVETEGCSFSLTKSYTACETKVFGGDTYISRFALKRKLPFFISNRCKLPNGTDVNYKDLGNVGQPIYYFNSSTNIVERLIPESRTDTFGQTSIAKQLTNIFGINNVLKAMQEGVGKTVSNARTMSVINGNDNNFDVSQGFFFYEHGYIYLYYYAIPYYLVESDINTNYRHGENNKEKDFYPHNSDLKRWLEEENVSIKNDNYYFYNKTLSKQNKESAICRSCILDKRDLISQSTNYNRLIYSDNSKNENQSDNWLLFKANNYNDFDLRLGKIVSADGIENDKLLIRMENGTQIVNAYDTLEASGTTIQVGTGGLFATRPKDIAITDLGHAGTQHKDMLHTPFGHIWADAERGHIFNLAPEASGIDEITKNGKNSWFKENLPFRIKKDFPTYQDIDNNLNGVGLHFCYDKRFNRFLVTKLDYKRVDQNVRYDADKREFYVIENGARKVVQLNNTKYFCDRSWTMSYNFYDKAWTSYHSYKPNMYIEYIDTFDSSIKTLSARNGKLITIQKLYKHNLTNKSYQVFYGKLEPFVVEYQTDISTSNNSINSVEYYLDVIRYHNEYDPFYVENKTFNKGIIYNDRDSSGLLNFVINDPNDLSQIDNYPRIIKNGFEILTSNSENIWRFNDFFNATASSLNNIPLFNLDCANVNKQINVQAINYNKKDYDKSVIRGRMAKVRLIQDKESNYKFIFSFGQTNKKQSFS